MAKKRDPRATTRRNARGEMYCPVPKAAPVKVPAAKPKRRPPVPKAAPVKVPAAKPKRRPPVPRLMPDQYGIAT